MKFSKPFFGKIYLASIICESQKFKIFQKIDDFDDKEYNSCSNMAEGGFEYFLSNFIIKS